MTEESLILKGIPASRGIYEGVSRVLFDPKEIDSLQNGDILVTRYSTPDWIEAYLLIGAVVTDEGGMNSHQAIVSRQLGIPCVVGTRDATKYVRDRERIRVDGNKGEIYRLSR